MHNKIIFVRSKYFIFIANTLLRILHILLHFSIGYFTQTVSVSLDTYNMSVYIKI
jgi:hypothetical protein